MKEMKTFTIKAIVKDGYSEITKIIESEYEATCVTNAIKMMREDLIGNGYSFKTNRIKEKSVFDFIVNETHCEPLAWKYINKVFPSYHDALSFISAKLR